ncbi:MAG: hypothetical protein JXR91_08520 [Deltaproteobacteria bacterium]|nr:hypothetical protein [Deltaproteobacteria bacterium]
MNMFKKISLISILLLSCSAQKGAKLPPPPQRIIPEAGICQNPKAGKNIRITKTMADSYNPEIIFTGRDILISWIDGFGRFPAIKTVRIDKNGIPRSIAKVLPHKATCKDQKFAVDENSVYGGWIEESKAVTADIGKPDVKTVSRGSEVDSVAVGPYGALVFTDHGKLYFRCDGMLPLPNRKGVIVEPEPLLVSTGGIESPAIAWTGEFFAIVWSESVSKGRRIVLQRVTNNGNLFGPKVAVSRTSGISKSPQITFNEKEFAIAWTTSFTNEMEDNDRYKVFFAIVKKDGISPLLTRQLDFKGSAEQVSLATSGKEYALAWVGSKKPAGSAVYFKRIDEKGKSLSETIKVTDDEPAACGKPSIAWTENGYGITWDDSRFFEGLEIFFSFMECNNTDTADLEDNIEPDTASDSENSNQNELKEIF